MTTAMRTRPEETAAPTLPAFGDGVFLDAATLGDRHAFEALVARYGPALHRYARRMLRDSGDVEEVVQDTFLAAWRRLDSFRGESSVQTWLFAICSRKIVDTHRVKRARPIDDRLLEPLVVSSTRGDPFVAASNAEFIVALEAALAELPARQRAVWVLREIESMSFVDIGTVLVLSPDATRGHYRRARTTLSERLVRWR